MANIMFQHYKKFRMSLIQLAFLPIQAVAMMQSNYYHVSVGKLSFVGVLKLLGTMRKQKKIKRVRR